MSQLSVSPIAHLRGCYPEKFGVPRQPGLVPSATGTVVFEEGFRRSEAVRGLDGFSHVWIVFLFDQVAAGEERLSVRPPRLGGNEKVGVFATRSPFRPNRIGLSAVKLERIGREGGEAPFLVVSGIDLIDGTPILDIKPYVPYADRIEDSEAAFAGEAPVRIEVAVDPVAAEQFAGLDATLQILIRETLSLDARPAYHAESCGERVYHFRVSDVEVDWMFRDGQCRIVQVRTRRD